MIRTRVVLKACATTVLPIERWYPVAGFLLAPPIYPIDGRLCPSEDDMTRAPRLIWLLCGLLLLPSVAGAQPLGTFSWQLQPFCNRVTVNVTQQGAVYTMDGYDDQCGAQRRAPIVGLGTPNPDGTIGLGWNIVTTPGGRGVQVDARITLPSASGSWSDSAGNAGTLALGASTGGNARPLPSPAAGIPAAFSLLGDGGFVARGTASVGIPATGAGRRMMWYPGRVAFRVGLVEGGQWDEVNLGLGSTGMGYNVVASGSGSVAMGLSTTASGNTSTALGFSTIASGVYSTATGYGTRASGDASTAMGVGTTASGSSSTAMGANTTAGAYSTAVGNGTTASGFYSTALGRDTTAGGVSSTSAGYLTSAFGNFSTAFGNTNVAGGSGSLVAGTASVASGVDAIALGVRVNANGTGSVVIGSDATAATPGVFMYGDRSTTVDLTTAGSNEFLVRAAGGTVFYSNAAMTTGVVLLNGRNSWDPINVSDENRKTDFRDLDGEQVLGKLAAMPIREWRYTTQDPAIRHAGPTAQDFRAAFGLGESDVRIGTVDADGIALAAVKALEVRTRELNATLTRENDELRESLAELRREIAALKRTR